MIRKTDEIITAFAERVGGPGWSNTLILVVVKNRAGDLRVEYLHPEAQTEGMRTLFPISAANLALEHALMHPDWVRSIRDQCQAAGVPFFFKQWGEWQEVPKIANGIGRMVRAGDLIVTPDGRTAPIQAGSLACDLEGEGIPMCKIGKKAAGAVLDGKVWREMPNARM